MRENCRNFETVSLALVCRLDSGSAAVATDFRHSVHISFSYICRDFSLGRISKLQTLSTLAEFLFLHLKKAGGTQPKRREETKI